MTDSFVLPGEASTTTTTGEQRPKWKKDAFINLRAPLGSGKTKKMCAIGFDFTKASEKALYDKLSADPKLLKRWLASLVADCQLASASGEGADFVIPE